MSVAGIGSQFSQLQGAKPANHSELHLMSCKRDVTQTFHSPTGVNLVKIIYMAILNTPNSTHAINQ